jgi:hypothetical protein
VITILEWCGVVIAVAVTALVVFAIVYAIREAVLKQRYRRARADRLRNGRHP